MANVVMMSIAEVKRGALSSDETDLIFAAKQGDHGAFNQLVGKYQDRIYNLAARISGSIDTAEDITQNTFVTAYLNLPRFRDGSFRSWLYRIATNLCYDEHRRHKRHPVLSIEENDLAEEKLSPLDNLSSPGLSPETEVDRHEIAQAVQKALDQLDTDQRTIIVLIDQNDFNYQEAAQVLGIPIGTVKSRLARARVRLHLLFGNFGLLPD